MRRMIVALVAVLAATTAACMPKGESAEPPSPSIPVTAAPSVSQEPALSKYCAHRTDPPANTKVDATDNGTTRVRDGMMRLSVSVTNPQPRTAIDVKLWLTVTIDGKDVTDQLGSEFGAKYRPAVVEYVLPMLPGWNRTRYIGEPVKAPEEWEEKIIKLKVETSVGYWCDASVEAK